MNMAATLVRLMQDELFKCVLETHCIECAQAKSIHHAVLALNTRCLDLVSVMLVLSAVAKCKVTF